ncbi:Melanoma-associated antigen B10 [Sciurus carolinensis]|uniref:Melanoma-associated antigen B10 n=1 Tax=Sciurus carolinensis TaxID=30640 RepID=A0AA41NEC5_SCICA|nr:melanoma-associated antigen B10-like [Sciurus carolinensis]MBZ3888815.1 Melanoma-associated antigen B10 [Sciurus carolinensis]
MPRGQKSKLRAREKRRQAQKETKNVSDVQAIAAKEESLSSSGPPSKDTPQSSSAAGAIGNQKEPGRTPSTEAAAGATAVSYTATKGNNQVEGKSNASQALIEHWNKSLLDQKVIVLVHYLLSKYQMKEPITKADMLRNVIQMHKNRYSEILKQASEHLELVFGLDLKEVDPNKNIYVLINKLELDHNAKVNDNRGIPKTGLLMTILGVIFTKGNCASEEQVWAVLNMMGVYDGKRHFIFGDPRKLITRDLVKEKYLEYRQVANSDPPRYEFLWGPRSHAETSKMKVLEFLAKIHNTIPIAFPGWYEEALKDEEERAQARLAARAHNAAKVTSSSCSCPK